MLKTASDIDAAHLFLNFVTQPDIAARISNSQFYATPNAGAEPLIDVEVLSNDIIYPPRDVLDRCEYIRDVGKVHSEYFRMYSMLK